MDGPLAFPADGQDQHLACSNVLRPAVRIVQRDPAMNDVANLRVRLAIGRKPPGACTPRHLPQPDRQAIPTGSLRPRAGFPQRMRALAAACQDPYWPGGRRSEKGSCFLPVQDSWLAAMYDRRAACRQVSTPAFAYRHPLRVNRNRAGNTQVEAHGAACLGKFPRPQPHDPRRTPRRVGPHPRGRSHPHEGATVQSFIC